MRARGFDGVIKNVRAVGALGKEKIRLFNPEFIHQTAKNYAKTFRDNPMGDALFVYGTTAFPALLSAGGSLPVNNFRRSKLEDPSSVSGDHYNRLLLKKEKKGAMHAPSGVSEVSRSMIQSMA